MEFQMKDTLQIQTDSLLAYMQSLGYKYENKGWVTDSEAMKHMRRLSHRTAIALHNLSENEWQIDDKFLFYPVINGRKLDLVMNGYTLSRTQAAKLVKVVKMQPNRKAVEGIQLQHHMVKPFKRYMTVTLGLN